MLFEGVDYIYILKISHVKTTIENKGVCDTDKRNGLLYCHNFDLATRSSVDG